MKYILCFVLTLCINHLCIFIPVYFAKSATYFNFTNCIIIHLLVIGCYSSLMMAVNCRNMQDWINIM
jgi:preprotein translocase subunit SecF